MARAQQPRTPTIGFLNSASRDAYGHLVSAFVQGLAQNGFVEGQNLAIEYRWADGRYDRLPSLADELLRRNVAIIVATGAGGFAAQAAKAATSTVPIVAGSMSGSRVYRVRSRFFRVGIAAVSA